VALHAVIGLAVTAAVAVRWRDALWRLQ